VQEEWRHQIRHKRSELFRACDGDERRQQRRRVADVDQGVEDQLDGHEQELGRQLAEQRIPQRPEPVLHGEDRRQPGGHGEQCRSLELVLWRHLLKPGELLVGGCTPQASNKTFNDL
jgi:hypothetical protein